MCQAKSPTNFQAKSPTNLENSKYNEYNINNQKDSRRLTVKSAENSRVENTTNKFDLNIKSFYTMKNGKRVPSRLEHDGIVVMKADNFDTPELFEQAIKKFMNEKRIENRSNFGNK